jgi:hypothetical protein
MPLSHEPLMVVEPFQCDFDAGPLPPCMLEGAGICDDGGTETSADWQFIWLSSMYHVTVKYA